MEEIIEEAYEKAIALIRKNTTPHGLMAVSSAKESLYPVSIYIRDTMIASLGASLGLGDEYRITYQRTLTALSRYQSELGQIPQAVTPKDGSFVPEYESQDSNLWYLLGHCYLYRIYKDKRFFKDNLASLERAILWLRYQDPNNDGLLEFPEGGNWMDFFGQRGVVLLDNVMWYGGLKYFAGILNECGRDGSEYDKMADDIKRKINILMWIDNTYDLEKEKEIFKMGRRRGWQYKRFIAEIAGRPFYLPYVEFMDFGEYLDTFANLMAILLGATNGEKTEGENRADLILNYIRDVGADRPYPITAVYPPIEPGNKSWRDYYRMGHVLREKSNTPYQYINGGIWPFIGGFYVAALVKCGRMEKAKEELSLLADANKKGYKCKWGFPEYLHGKTGNVMGGDYFSWSAGMYIYAYECVKRKKVIGLE